MKKIITVGKWTHLPATNELKEAYLGEFPNGKKCLIVRYHEHLWTAFLEKETRKHSDVNFLMALCERSYTNQPLVLKFKIKMVYIFVTQKIYWRKPQW